MSVDIHVHVGSLRGRVCDADQLCAYVEATGLEAALVAHADHTVDGDALDEVDANVAALELHRRDRRLLPLYWGRPGFFDSSPEAFAGALSREPFVAALFSPALHRYTLDDTERLAPYLTALARQGRPAVIAVAGGRAAPPERIYDLAKRLTAVPFVLFDALATVHRNAALDVAARAAQQSDVRIYLDTAGADADEIVQAVEVVGPARVMFGSGGCEVAEAHATAVTQTLGQLRQALGAADFEQVTTGNALEVFQLDAQLADD